MTAAIQIDNLGKRYQKLYDPDVQQGFIGYATLRESLTNLVLGPVRRLRGQSGARPQEFWALKDVSFEVQTGEAVGIIGRNGAGKSTLLKILSRITKPTAGQARLRGRVGSLLEVGTGFHPELTGRENIFLNGSILGMSRKQIAARFDEIVAFAGVETFLDTPVKRYSNGMYGRLAFAVAAHLEPEILVIDEVLAVGDAEFQKKCITKMGDVASQGRTVLFVSHDMAAIQAVCRRAVLLADGQVRMIAPARDVVAEYLKISDAISAIPLLERRDRRGVGRFRFAGLTLLDAAGSPRDCAVTGEDMILALKVQTPEGEGTVPAPLDVVITIRDYQGQRITSLGTYFTGNSPTDLAQCRELTCRVPRLPLLHGQYRLDLWCATSFETQDVLADAAILRVEPGPFFPDARDARMPSPGKHGCVLMPQEWGSGLR